MDITWISAINKLLLIQNAEMSCQRKFIKTLNASLFPMRNLFCLEQIHDYKICLQTKTRCKKLIDLLKKKALFYFYIY